MPLSTHDYVMVLNCGFFFQVEMNPSWQQEKLREFCKQKGIHVSAWSPLGAYKVFWGSGAVMENKILHDIATAKGKTIAQVIENYEQENPTTYSSTVTFNNLSILKK